jgi:hypothetical protein
MIEKLRLLRELELLTGNGSQKSKQDLIKSNIDDKLKYILDVCFNPFVTTKLHKISYNEVLSESNPNLWEDFRLLLEELKIASAANDNLRGRACDLISAKISDDPKEDLELRSVLMKMYLSKIHL